MLVLKVCVTANCLQDVHVKYQTMKLSKESVEMLQDIVISKRDFNKSLKTREAKLKLKKQDIILRNFRKSKKTTYK